jgi:hypothetical protein
MLSCDRPGGTGPWSCLLNVLVLSDLEVENGKDNALAARNMINRKNLKDEKMDSWVIVDQKPWRSKGQVSERARVSDVDVKLNVISIDERDRR